MKGIDEMMRYWNGYGVKKRNLEGQMAVGFVKMMKRAVVNTNFKKTEEHRMTCKSGRMR